SRSRLHHQRTGILQRPGHRHRHLLLLGAEFEVLQPRERTLLAEEIPDAGSQTATIGATHFRKGNHDPQPSGGRTPEASGFSPAATTPAATTPPKACASPEEPHLQIPQHPQALPVASLHLPRSALALR